MTLQQSLEDAVRTLTAGGFAPHEATVDGGVLARHLMGWSLGEWIVRARSEAPAEYVERLKVLVDRRLKREPVAYLTGTREFYGRDFRVTPAVLIPRPETEGVVEEALAVLGSEVPEFRGSEGSTTVVDVGTGSGCIGVTIALEWPEARVVATDCDRSALAIAIQNAGRLDAQGVEFHRVSGSAFLPTDLPPVDVIVSNPPYVPERDRDALQPDVRDFEPVGALFAGEDGLDVIRQLLPVAFEALKPGGWLVMEMGRGQRNAVVDLARTAGFTVERVGTDLQRIPRVIVARRETAG